MTNDYSSTVSAGSDVISAEKLKIRVPRPLHAKFLILEYLLRGRHKVRAARIKRWRKKIKRPHRHLGTIEDQNSFDDLKNNEFTRWVAPLWTQTATEV